MASVGPVLELCAITAQPARFRDPQTGLAYSDSYAYKEIQRLQAGSYRWSTLLGCYVGPVTSGARGVPGRFGNDR
jgi:vacuolar protein sorting-associated protein 72